MEDIAAPDLASDERVKTLSSLKPGSHVHLSAICGTGMAAVAQVLKDFGYLVTGSDKAFYPPMGEVVRKIASKIFEGYRAENLDPCPDFVIIGNNLSRTNPEVEKILADRIPFASMPEAFAALLIRERNWCRNSVVVAGTHGKTTTTAAIATLLDKAGRHPGYFIGGVPRDLPTGLRPPAESIPPQKRVVVLEGDEYDSAFFAKWPKFHSYRPDIVVFTSLEFDHADIYNNVDEIEREFVKLARKVPPDGAILVCTDYQRLVDAICDEDSGVKCRIFRYGSTANSELRLLSRKAIGDGQKIHVDLLGEKLELDLKVSGPQNAANLLAAAGVCKLLDIDSKTVASVVNQFTGVLRRQYVVGEYRGITLVEDFAHHPTAVKLTLEGLREQYGNRRIIAVFEPRSNTSRRGAFQREYPVSFGASNLVYLLEVQDKTVYSAVGGDTGVLDVKELVSDINSHKVEAHYAENVTELENAILTVARTGDVIVCMSNGDFGGLIQRLSSRLSAH